jgi:hypothetical protein
MISAAFACSVGGSLSMSCRMAPAVSVDRRQILALLRKQEDQTLDVSNTGQRNDGYGDNDQPRLTPRDPVRTRVSRSSTRGRSAALPSMEQPSRSKRTSPGPLHPMDPAARSTASQAPIANRLGSEHATCVCSCRSGWNGCHLPASAYRAFRKRPSFLPNDQIPDGRACGNPARPASLERHAPCVRVRYAEDCRAS